MYLWKYSVYWKSNISLVLLWDRLGNILREGKTTYTQSQGKMEFFIVVYFVLKKQFLENGCMEEFTMLQITTKLTLWSMEDSCTCPINKQWYCLMMILKIFEQKTWTIVWRTDTALGSQNVFTSYKHCININPFLKIGVG